MRSAMRSAMATAMPLAIAGRIGAVRRAVRPTILAAVILTATILAGSSVAAAHDEYVDGPIAEGVSEGPDPSRPIDVSEPAGADTIEGAAIAGLGRLLSSILTAAIQ